MRLATILLAAIFCMVIATACPKPATNPSGTSGAHSAGTHNPSGESTNEAGEGTEGTASEQGETGMQNGMPHNSSGSGGLTTGMGSLPDRWPEGIPIMDGFTVQAHSQIVGPPLMINLGLVGTPSVDEATAFYTSMDGWERNNPLPWNVTGPERFFNVKRGAHEFLGITIKTENGKTSVAFVYSDDTMPNQG
jgi:hypothetical protein